MLDRIACFSVYYLKTWGNRNGGCVGWSQETCGAGWVHTSSSAEYYCSWHWLDSNSSRAKRCQEHGTSGNLLRVLVVLVWFSLGLVASSFFFLSHALTSNFMGFFSIPPIQQFQPLLSDGSLSPSRLHRPLSLRSYIGCLEQLGFWTIFFWTKRIRWSKLDFKNWGVLFFWERSLMMGLQ